MRIAILSLALVFGTTAFANDELDQQRTVAQPVAAKPSADQIAKAKDLPQSTIIRVSKAELAAVEAGKLDKSKMKVEVAFVKDKVPAGVKLDAAQFEKMAMNGEKIGIAYSAKDELDAVSSTSSWSYGYARGPRGNSAGYIAGPRGGVGFVNGRYGGAVAGYGRGGYYGYGARGYYGGGYYGGGAYYGGGYYGGGTAVVAGGSYYGPGAGCYIGGCNNCINSCDYMYPQYNYAGYQYNYAPVYGWEDNSYVYANCNWLY